MDYPNYPVSEVRELITKHTAEPGSGFILEAPPGSGKSTLVPLFLLEESWFREDTTQNDRIILLQPRRAAARAINQRLRYLSGNDGLIGYQTRYERDIPENCKIIVMTEGIFVRKIIGDPELRGVRTVILDEFHERSIDTDLSFVLLQETKEALRPDIRIILMSATLNTAGLSQTGLPIIRAEGKLHEVEISYHPGNRETPVADLAAMVALDWIRSTSLGNLLVFLPGEGEIHRCISFLNSRIDSNLVQILPLYGKQRISEQQKALLPTTNNSRKIIVSTNIAETSLTIEGIGCVIDSGLRRAMVYEDGPGINRMVTTRISRASAIQRAGRAGRLGPGQAIRLWHETEYLEPFDSPEIMNTELSSVVLKLAAWGNANPEQYQWLNPPPDERFESGRELLFSLEALDYHSTITPKGRLMVSLPLSPRLASLVVVAAQSGNGKQVSLLAAILEIGDPLTHESSSEFGSDLNIRMDLILKPDMVPENILHKVRCASIEQEQKRIFQILENQKIGNTPPTNPLGLEELLYSCYPDRLAKLQSDGTYQLVTGSRSTLKQGKRGFSPPWIIAVDLQMRGSGGSIFLAIGVSDSTIKHICEKYAKDREVLFLDNSRIKARRIKKLGRIEISSTPVQLSQVKDINTEIMALIRDHGVNGLPWSQTAKELQTRLLYLHNIQGHPWPDVNPETLSKHSEFWLPQFLPGIIETQSLSTISMEKVLEYLIPWEIRGSLDSLAPARFLLPSGTYQKLRYTREKAILSARIQQLFGLNESPRIGGKSLEIELLSPARRPVQITSDLASFWLNTYPQIRKELRGRYSKHYWPEDPLTAKATDKLGHSKQS